MHKLNQITMKTKLFFRIICILSALLINLSLLKPGFSQATVEYHNLSVDGSIKGAISIMFPEGWSTYWKFPGPNGFIPNLRVLDKENLKSFSISWPYPKTLGPNNFTYLGFDDDLLLPVKIEKFSLSISLFEGSFNFIKASTLPSSGLNDCFSIIHELP